jgi:hypothetical protein
METDHEPSLYRHLEHNANAKGHQSPPMASAAARIDPPAPCVPVWIQRFPNHVAEKHTGKPAGCKAKCVLPRADLTSRLRPQFLGAALASVLLAKDCKPKPFPFGLR